MRRRPQTPSTPASFAKNKVMELFARRDHSEKEIRSKLRLSFRRGFLARKRIREKAGKEFTENFEDQQEEINSAIEGAVEFARSNGWLGDASVLAEKMAGMLHRRKKGIKYINNFLHGKGLPEVHGDRDLELEKALALVKNKFSDLSDLKFEDKRKEQARIARFLAARGFDSETVRKVIYEEL